MRCLGRLLSSALVLALCTAAFLIALDGLFLRGLRPEEAVPTPLAEVTPTPAPTISPEARLLRGMSLEQKVRQLLLVSCHDASNARKAAEFGAGGVCLYANFFSGRDAESVQSAVSELQGAAEVPLLVSVDEEGGGVCRVSSNSRLRAARFPSPRRLYRDGGWAGLEEGEREKARFLLGFGINVNLAPVCDVPTGSGDYIYGRSFGTDAALTAEFVDRAVRVANAEGIGCTLKHFPGYGGSNDTHGGTAYDDRAYETFLSADFKPFAAGIAAGAPSVMVSHNIVRCMDAENPASLSPEVHRILREELGFSGVIVTDDLYMGAIRQFLGGENAAVRAILAGNDLLCCADYASSAAAIVAAVEDGTIPEERIDESALRVLRWKRALGLI